MRFSTFVAITLSVSAAAPALSYVIPTRPIATGAHAVSALPSKPLRTQAARPYHSQLNVRSDPSHVHPSDGRKGADSPKSGHSPKGGKKGGKNKREADDVIDMILRRQAQQQSGANIYKDIGEAGGELVGYFTNNFRRHSPEFRVGTVMHPQARQVSDEGSGASLWPKIVEGIAGGIEGWVSESNNRRDDSYLAARDSSEGSGASSTWENFVNDALDVGSIVVGAMSERREDTLDSSRHRELIDELLRRQQQSGANIYSDIGEAAGELAGYFTNNY